MYWRTTTVCSTVEWTLFLQLLVRMSGYIKLFNLRATEVPTLGKAYVTIIVYECSVGKTRLKYSSDKNTHFKPLYVIQKTVSGYSKTTFRYFHGGKF